MAGYVTLGALAAFGLVCAVWILWGLLHPEAGQGTLIYSGTGTVSMVRRYLWLREMGVLHCPLAVMHSEGMDIPWLEDQGIEICSREELLSRLEIGAK